MIISIQLGKKNYIANSKKKSVIKHSQKESQIPLGKRQVHTARVNLTQMSQSPSRTSSTKRMSMVPQNYGHIGHKSKKDGNT